MDMWKPCWPVLLLWVSINAQAQVPIIEWQRAYGGSDTDIGYALDATQDGGFIVAGTVEDKVEMSPRSSVMAISGW